MKTLSKKLTKEQLINEYHSYEFGSFHSSQLVQQINVLSLQFHLNRLCNMRWSHRYMKVEFASLLNSLESIFNRLYHRDTFVDYLELI